MMTTVLFIDATLFLRSFATSTLTTTDVWQHKISLKSRAEVKDLALYQYVLDRGTLRSEG